MAAVRDHLFGAGAGALEPGQFDALSCWSAGRLAHVEMAGALRVDPSAARAVQRLLKTGLAERHPYRGTVGS
jgi:hypothetical protein